MMRKVVAEGARHGGRVGSHMAAVGVVPLIDAAIWGDLGKKSVLTHYTLFPISSFLFFQVAHAIWG
jgi:hypothetical protein